MGEVITTEKFKLVSPDVLRDLENAGIKLSTKPLEELGLSEVKYGEVVIGELNADERRVFATLHAVNEECERLSRIHGAMALRKLGDAVEAGKEKEIFNSIQSGAGAGDDLGLDPDGAREFFMLERLRNYLHASLHYTIAERLGFADYVLGVRTRGRVVRASRKW